MGTTLNKLQYLDTTKGQIKTALNQFNAGITDNDTFRSYVDKIDDIYDNWEKVTSEGTNITLNNTKKGKLYYENNKVVYGNTEQYSTQGYNLLNIYARHDAGYTETVSDVKFTYNSDGSVTAKGTATADITYFLASRASLGNDIFNGTNYLSGCTGGSLTTFYLSFWADTIGTFTQTTTEVATNKTSGVNWNIVIIVKNGTTIDKTFYPMMCATSGKPFEPYTNGASPNPSYPQEVKCVTGTQTVKIKNSSNEVITTKTLSLGNYKPSKIGNYRDYFWTDRDTKKWYIHKDVGEYTFTGQEQISLNQNKAHVFQFTISNVINSYGDYSNYAKCNRFKYKYGNPDDNTDENYFWIYNSVTPVIVIKKTIVTDLGTFKTWLANNQTKLYYRLLTPTDTEITDTTLKSQLEEIYNLMSLNGTTKIEIDGNLPLILKVGALKGGN